MSDIKRVQLIRTRLDEALAVADPSHDDLYELATALAQAVRLHRMGAPELASSIARGRALLASAPAEAVLDALRVDALLDAVEAQLEDEEALPELIFAVLVEVDEHAAAAALLGVPQKATDLLHDAVTLLRVHNDAALQVQGLGAAYRAAQGILPTDSAAALWDAVAEAQPEDEPLVPEPILPGIAAWIEAEARKSAPVGGKVLAFRLPLKRADAGPEPLRVAASSGALPVPEASEVVADPGGRWQVVVLRRGVLPELAIIADPTENIEVFVEADGHAVSPKDDGDGARSVELRPEVSTWRVGVDGQVFEFSWADTP